MPVDALNTIEVLDKEGWRQQVVLPAQRLIQIGSAEQNDVVLAPGRGTGVAPRHLQLLELPTATDPTDAPPRFRLINLTDQGVAQVTPAAEGERQRLLPRSTADVGDGAQVRVGDFELVLHLAAPAAAAAAEAQAAVATRTQAPAARAEAVEEAPAASGPQPAADVHASANIGIELDLPDTQLELDHALEGTVTVRNQGDQPGVQFWLSLEGLDPQAYEMGPGPILFPNAERQVLLRLSHPREPYPPAGPHQITVRAIAPAAYPDQAAEASQTIQIAPFYRHELHIRPAAESREE